MRRRRLRRKRYSPLHQEGRKEPIGYKLFGLFLVVLFFMGIIYGALIYRDYSDKIELSEVIHQIQQYYGLAKSPTIDRLIQKLIQEFTIFFLLWFLSLTIIGIIIVLFALFCTGFIVGFILWFFIGEYGSEGLMIGLLYMFPKNMVLIPFSIYFTQQILRNALQLFSSIYINKHKNAFQHHLKQSLQLLLFTIGVILLYALIDAISMPWVGDQLRRLL